MLNIRMLLSSGQNCKYLGGPSGSDFTGMGAIIEHFSVIHFDIRRQHILIADVAKWNIYVGSDPDTFF